MREQDSALQRQQDLLLETQALAGVGSFEWDVRSGKLIWSSKLFELFGVDPSSFEPSFEAYLSFVHPEDRTYVRAAIGAALDSRGQFEIQERIIRRDGEIRILLSRGRVVCDDQNQPLRMFGACLDITDHSRAIAQAYANEARYRAFIDHTSDCLVLHDINGIILDVNSRMCSVTGYSREELIGKTPLLYNHQLSAESLRALCNRLITQESISFETEHIDRYGRVFPVEVRLRRFLENGVPRAVSLVLDITERRQAEAARAKSELALRESNEKYRIVTESLGHLIWVVSPDNVIEYISPSTLQFLGRSINELSNAAWSDVVHPDDRPLFQQQIRSALQSGQPTEVEIRGRRYDGQFRWMFARTVPILDEQSRVIKWLGSAIDIHDRKSAQEAQRASEERLQLLLESANIVLWEADPATFQFKYISDHCEQLLGYPIAEWLKAGFWKEHLHPDDAHEAFEICRHASESGVDHRLEYRMIAADGRIVWIEDTVHMHVEAGRVVGMRGILQNISQRKLLEDQLRQSQKMEAIGRLAGGIAHDFNNILTVMMGYSEFLLLNTLSDDPKFAALNAINDAGKRAAALTRQLLTFSRKAIIAPKVLDLNQLVRSTEALLRPTIGEDITLSIETDPSVRPIKADKVHIEQVIMNLAINARDAMPSGGRIRIATLDRVNIPVTGDQQLGDYVALVISDTGCGIADDVLGKIFDPFFTTKEVGRGTGLGLSVVHGVVTGAGGFIHVDSQPGVGTTFTLCFPAAVAQTTTLADKRVQPQSRGAETILLVEDDVAVRLVTMTTLTQQGYRVVDASSGNEALQAFEKSPSSFDLLLTDVVMPGMSGRQLAESIRQMRPDIPVLFMSGHTDDAVVQHGIRSSADTFIQKPFTPQSLGHKLRELFVRSKE